MVRIVAWVSASALLLFLASACWLAAAQRRGPAHAEAWLDDGTPLTIALPRQTGDAEAFVAKSSAAQRPPVVILMHGFAGDRRGMSRLGWRLTRAGYAVIAFDAPGHGVNRNAYLGGRAASGAGRARPDLFAGVFGRVVDFARGYPFVDGSRIAVGGHSMGAQAALDYATRDPGIDATLLLSGGSAAIGPYRPSNALFLIGEFEPARIRARVERGVSSLAPDGPPPLGQTTGDHRLRTALRRSTIPGTGHAGIVNAGAAAREIIAWLDASFELEREGLPGLSDPRRLPALLAVASLFLCLPGLGLAVARLAGQRHLPPHRGPLALLLFATGPLVALPLVANGSPLSFLPFEVGDVIASLYAYAGGSLLLLLLLTGRFDVHYAAADLRRAGVGAFCALAILLALAQPLGASVHTAMLTPVRALLLPALLLSLLPLSFAFELYLRRGAPREAALRCLAGRLLIVGALALGVYLGLLSPVLMRMLGALLALFLGVELIASTLYARARDPLCLALIDAGSLALLIAIAMPIRL